MLYVAPPGTLVVINNRPNDCASWAPPGEDGWYIGPEMEHYICHKTYTPNTIVYRISDTVEFPPKQFDMTKMSSKDALFIWDISWFTCVSFSWATYLTGILGSTAGELAFLNISYRVMNEYLCPFPIFNSGLAGDGFCIA